ncbi:unnamed protein product [Pylaiella littoralis]
MRLVRSHGYNIREQIALRRAPAQLTNSRTLTLHGTCSGATMISDLGHAIQPAAFLLSRPALQTWALKCARRRCRLSYDYLLKLFCEQGTTEGSRRTRGNG